MYVYIVMKYLGFDGQFGDVEIPERVFSTKEKAQKYINNKKGYSILKMKVN